MSDTVCTASAGIWARNALLRAATNNAIVCGAWSDLREFCDGGEGASLTATSRTLQHVGEWKIELRATAIGELFVELARIIADAIGPGSSPGAPGGWERVELVARDRATLLVDWANELIGRSEVAGRAYRGVRNLVLDSGPGTSVRLTADVRGDPVDEWASPVKAATYHDADVTREGGGWRATVLLDV